MKFDLKTILILVLLVVSTVFGLMWFFGGSDVSKEKVKQLEKEYKKLEQEKKVADAKILVWQGRFNIADAKDKKLSEEIIKSKADAKLADEKAKKSKADLDKVKGSIEENRKEIENLKKNPPVLTDEQLLEALIKMTLIFTTMFSQLTPEIKYPKFEVDSLGQKVIVMTIPQAMKLNNNSDLLKKFEAQDIKIKEYETLCVKVISEKDDVITKLNLTIGKQDGQLLVKDDKIKSLQNEILGWMERNKVLESQLVNRSEIIDEKNKQLVRLKTKMIIGGSIGSIAIITLILTSIGVIH